MIKLNILNLTSPAQHQADSIRSDYGLDNHGLRQLNNEYWNLPAEALYEEIIFRSEGSLTGYGAIAVLTGEHTKLAVDDKFIVQEAESETPVWWGEFNRPFSIEKFNTVYQRMLGYMQGRDVFVRDCYGGVDARHRLPLRVITEQAWHSLMIRNLFSQPETNEEFRAFVPEFTIIAVPSFKAQPEIDGTLSSTFILLNLDQRLCLIGGSAYGGEIKKSIFTILNLLMTHDRTLTMRCSANSGPEGTALFFGETGTGKTALATDSTRALIGDDQHGWCQDGVFNLERGCYAKLIALSPDDDPEIFRCTTRYGTIIENVKHDPVTRKPDFDDDSITDNSRATYRLKMIKNSSPMTMNPDPKNIFLLTCDATGALPPIARLTPDQAVYQFVSGYSSRVDGPKTRTSDKPETVFSACFGAPFMVHHPERYARLLHDKILRHDVNCWLVNTGWTDGPFKSTDRIKIAHTRRLIRAALNGSLDQVAYRTDPVFGFEIPESCNGIPGKMFDPSHGWDDPVAYRDQLIYLAGLFIENFKKFAKRIPDNIVNAGPKITDLQSTKSK